MIEGVRVALGTVRRVNKDVCPACFRAFRRAEMQAEEGPELAGTLDEVGVSRESGEA